MGAHFLLAFWREIRPKIKYKVPSRILAVMLKVMPMELFASLQFCIVRLKMEVAEDKKLVQVSRAGHL